MQMLKIIVAGILLTVAFAYIDTKDHKFRPGTPFRKNILPSAIRVAVVFFGALWVIPRI